MPHPRRIFASMLILTLFVALLAWTIACGSQKAPTTASTPNIQATLTVLVTQAMPTPPPTSIPVPTPDVIATAKAQLEKVQSGILATIAAIPTPTPQPTFTPPPTFTPYPTLQPLPTYTPPPTATPYPTATPVPPTATPVPPTATPRPTSTATPRPTPTIKPSPTPLPQKIPLSKSDPSAFKESRKKIGEAFSLYISLSEKCRDPQFDGHRPYSNIVALSKSIRLSRQVGELMEKGGHTDDMTASDLQHAIDELTDIAMQLVEICLPPDWTPDWTATTTSTSEGKLGKQQVYLLTLINNSRKKAGLTTVILGSNKAAQEHVEAMLSHGFTSHWGLDGLTPTMRYTLAGGTNYISENTSGVSGIKESDWGPHYRTLPWQTSLTQIHQGLLDSPGHRRNIMNKWHKKVSLGIACNKYTCSVVENFEGDYVEFTQTPRISKAGILTFAGKLKHGFDMTNIHIWHHQTPHPLTLGQLDASYSYNTGQTPAIFITDPPAPGYYYSAANLLPSSYTWTSGVDPYSVDSQTPRAKLLSAGQKRPTPLNQTSQKAVPWTVADKWSVGPFLDVRANVQKALHDMGPGVYIIVIWATNNGETIPLTNYTIFIK